MSFINNDPVSAHRFVLTIGNEMLGAFTEITLPTLEYETEERKEGGLNEWSHTMLTRRKSGRLVLKRGLLKASLFMDWYLDMTEGKMKDVRKEVSVILFDSTKNVVGWWFFGNVFPIKWTGPQLKSDQAAVAIETLELAVHDYQYVEM